MKRYRLLLAFVLAIIAVPILVPIVIPWTRINCRTQEINIKTGQARDSRHLWFVKVSESIEDTPVSVALQGKRVDVAEIKAWHRVNSFDLWHGNSPHHNYHGALNQIRQLSIAYEVGGYSSREEEAFAVELLTLWQVNGSYFGADAFVEATAREAMQRYDRAHSVWKPSKSP